MHLNMQSTIDRIEYDGEMALVAARIIKHYQETDNMEKGLTLLQTYSLAKGLKVFGKEGEKAATKEMKQLDVCGSFEPIDVGTLAPLEHKRVMESLIFLVQKKTGEVKACHCANGSKQRDWMTRQDSSSPTVKTHSLFLTAAIDAKEQQHVKTADAPNAFVQTALDEIDKDSARTIMKICGALVDILVNMDQAKYAPFVIYKGKQKVLYVHILRTLYGLLQASLLYYKKFRKDIESHGFVVNPYDPCVANKMVEGKQLTLTWHVDDFKMSHVKEQVLDNFVKWLRKTYDAIGEVKVTNGKQHFHLGMTLDYSKDGAVIIDMKDYVTEMIEEFPDKLESSVKTTANKNLFSNDPSSQLLSPKRAKLFHTMVAKALFLSKQARPDIQTANSFLCTRVSKPTVSDWSKLVRLMTFLKETRDDCLKLEMDDSLTGCWYIDAAFAVHPDM